MSAPQCEVRIDASPFGGYLEKAEITVPNKCDVIEFLSVSRQTLEQILQSRLEKLKGVKFWMCVVAEYYRSVNDKDEKSAFFPNNARTVLNDDDIKEQLDESYIKIASEVESFEENGSDWILKNIVKLDFYTTSYSPLRASSYVPLPKSIQLKRAIVNVHNRDNKCFLWSLLAALHPVEKNAERVSNYENCADLLDFSEISFPMQIKDIPKFTNLNDISVNIFSLNSENRVFPLYRAKVKLERHVNLFMHDHHYSWIKNFDRLLGDQNSHKARGFYCEMCLYPMFSQEKLDQHVLVCKNDNLAAIDMPSEDDNVLRFKNIHKMLKKPLVVYADFEAILNPYHGCESKPDQPYTFKYQEHVPCSYGMVVAESCCGKPKFKDMQIHTDVDPASRFLEKTIDIAERYSKTVNCCPLSMSQEDEKKFTEAADCFVCEKPLLGDRVRDHCHTCGRFRGALHSQCNQTFRLDREVVVVMHNLRRYDAHIIMQSIGRSCKAKKLRVDCVAKAIESYLNFSVRPRNGKWKIRFIDSAQFLQAPLEKLVQQLEPDQFQALGQYFNDQQIKLLARKGVFPYDFLNSWESLRATHPIPKDSFYNKLNEKHLSDEDYDHYLAVCRYFDITDLQNYMELYLATDVLLLADVFEQFRGLSQDNYGLDPCHYSTLPGLAWDACLKMTKVELELLTDPDMYTFFEQGIRGGISVICHRLANANNKYMKDWVEDMMQSFIIYYDANNLYGWAMRQLLPIDGFKWVTEDELSSLNIPEIDPAGETGYVFEVDLEYPADLHDEHNCYPLAPEKLDITEDMLSPYCLDIAKKHGIKTKKTAKLAPNLMDKKRYIVHYRNLQYYLKKGLKLTKVHRALTFRQARWLAPYIDFNTQKRREAVSEFVKSFYKLIVNVVFGKTMENVRKYITVELVTDEKRLRKVTKKPEFQRAVIFSDDLVGCSVGRKVIYLDKPIYVGFAVLDGSKQLMYAFHYEYIRQIYGNDAVLLMTDTDSLMYHITTTRDIYKDMLEFSEIFDTSDYPADHFLQSNVNKKAVGKMKDELNGEPAESFVGLRSKMYSIKCGADEKKRAKGVKRRVVEDKITHQDYYDVLENQQQLYHRMNAIRSFQHHLYSVTMNKKSLSCYDDKRYILDDGVTTLAYGHCKINS